MFPPALPRESGGNSPIIKAAWLLGFCAVMGRIAEVTGAAAMVVALTATVSAQTGSNFLSNIDPLFAGVLARPGNLDNTIQYAASAAAHGDIESAISAYEQLRFYNSHQGAVTIETPAAVIGIRGGIGIFSRGPNGLQAANLNGHQSIQNGAHRLYGERSQLEYAAERPISDPARLRHQ
jgi:low affinity Fe/Cu permease